MKQRSRVERRSSARPPSTPPRLPCHQARQLCFDRLFHIVEACCSACWIDVQDQVAGRQPATPRRSAKDLPSPAFGAVSRNRTTEFLGHRDPESRTAAGTRRTRAVHGFGQEEGAGEVIPNSPTLLVAARIGRRRAQPLATTQRFSSSARAHAVGLRRHLSRLGVVRQTASRLRPLRRRRQMMALPCRVFIRARKPCFFFRRRLLGW